MSAFPQEFLNLRVGTGFDAHAFSSDRQRPLVLAGLIWEGIGLEGHSDADVATHSMIDALLSAAHLGDIGSEFGVDSPETLEASSIEMLKKTVQKLHDNSYEIINLSLQIIGNRPKFSPRRDEAQDTLTQILGAPVSIVATTSDGFGFTGRGEGVAAISNALVYKTQ